MDFSSIRELNVEKGLGNVADEMDIYIMLLESFIEITPETLDNLSEHLRTGNYSEYTTEVHGLKSSLANIGAEELSEMARRLEFAAKKNNIGFLLDFNDGLVEDVSLLCEKIAAAMN